MFRALASLTVACTAALLVGCGSDKPANSTPPPANSNSGTNTPPPDTGPKAPGVVAFEAANCNNCHSTVGSPKTGRGMGPDLSKVGAKHDKEWIVAHIRDPKSHNPGSRMPAADATKLSDKDAGTIGEYLAGQK